MFRVIGSAQSIREVAGKEFGSFDYFRDAMRYAYEMGRHFEVHAPDGKVFNPMLMAGGL